LLPVGFPSNASRRSLMAFMSPMSSTSAIFLGISMERLFGNGTMLFRTKRGLYHMFFVSSPLSLGCGYADHWDLMLQHGVQKTQVSSTPKHLCYCHITP
jgi:hypothetical protein